MSKSKAELEREAARQRMYRENLRVELLDVKVRAIQLDNNNLRAGHVGINEKEYEWIRAQIRQARELLENAAEVFDRPRQPIGPQSIAARNELAARYEQRAAEATSEPVAAGYRGLAQQAREGKLSIQKAKHEEVFGEDDDDRAYERSVDA